MGVSLAVSRLAVRHAHVLLVEVPGHWLTRIAAERHVLGRGWRLALAPADADVLAVCGSPGPELAVLVGRLWDEIPGPRARVTIDAPQAVSSALVAAESGLFDTAGQVADSRRRATGLPPAARRGVQHRGGEDAGHGEVGHGSHADMQHGGMKQGEQHAGHGHMAPGNRGGMQHEGHGSTRHTEHEREEHGRPRNMRHGGMEQREHDGHENGSPGGEHGRSTMDRAASGGINHGGHGAMARGGHGGMSRGGMDTAPAGIPLAHGGEDRDGLEMDVLHVRLGPILPYWPAGLVVRCTMQGDVIAEAESSVIDAGDFGHRGEAVGERDHAACRCDNAARLLALAGWEDAAGWARRIRDSLLFGTDLAALAAEVDRLRRTVRRSWMLKWSLRGLGPLTAGELARRDLPGTLEGDVHDRLLAMLDCAARSVSGQHGSRLPHAVRVEVIPDLVRGWDLAAARLIVASLDFDPLPVVHEANHA